MAGVAVGDPVVALKLSPTVLFSAATGNNVTYHGQNLTFTAEEQINATRLFKQLYSQIETTLALRDRKELDVKEAMEKTLALDKAYLLPLLGSMVEKFPENSEPAIWWSKPNVSPSRKQVMKTQGKNGWSENLEEAMDLGQILYTLEGSIESTIQERDLEKKEEGELFEMNVALKLVAA
nr:probable F-box protein At4g22030 [Populus alba]